jgi:YegS/Rv2252/BmrU family lipid kinase
VEPLLLITNAEAGSGDDENLQEALTVLRREADVEVARTTNPGELDGVLQRRGRRRLVVGGGDGSLHAVVAALHRRHELEKGALALIPLGTGNDFARGSGIPLEVGEAARLAIHGEARTVDLLVNCAGQVVVNAVHFGIGAEAGKQASAWKKWLGRVGYPVGALIAGFRQHGIRLRVEADGQVLADLDRPLIQVALGNGATVGGGTEIAPQASVEDGLADVVVSFATTPLAKLTYTMHLASASHEEREDVVMVKAKRISISGQDFYCNADGEIYGPEVNHEWHVEPGAFEMVLPPRTSA